MCQTQFWFLETFSERCTGDLVYGCTNCELKCNEPPKMCSRICYPGCQCPEDLYRYGSGDKCYKEQDCPEAHIVDL